MVGVDSHEFVIADIPGLIEGAHEGQGLGDRFLGHIERCRVLLHLIDGVEDKVVDSYQTIRGELEAYGNGLADKPEIVAINKADASIPELMDEQVAALRKVTKSPILILSGAAGLGVVPALRAIWKVVEPYRLEEAARREREAEAAAAKMEQTTRYITDEWTPI